MSFRWGLSSVFCVAVLASVLAFENSHAAVVPSGSSPTTIKTSAQALDCTTNCVDGVNNYLDQPLDDYMSSQGIEPMAYCSPTPTPMPSPTPEATTYPGGWPTAQPTTGPGGSSPAPTTTPTKSPSPAPTPISAGCTDIVSQTLKNCGLPASTKYYDCSSGSPVQRQRPCNSYALVNFVVDNLTKAGECLESIGLNPNDIFNYLGLLSQESCFMPNLQNSAHFTGPNQINGPTITAISSSPIIALAKSSPKCAEMAPALSSSPNPNNLCDRVGLTSFSTDIYGRNVLYAGLYLLMNAPRANSQAANAIASGYPNCAHPPSQAEIAQMLDVMGYNTGQAGAGTLLAGFLADPNVTTTCGDTAQDFMNKFSSWIQSHPKNGTVAAQNKANEVSSYYQNVASKGSKFKGCTQ